MKADRMFWIEVESPPRHPGDPLVALSLLMKRVGQAPFRLRAVEQVNLVQRKVTIVYQAWPPDAWPGEPHPVGRHDMNEPKQEQQV